MILHVASQIYSKTEQPKNDHFQKISKESRFRLEEYSKLNSSAENTLLSIFRQQSFLTHQITVITHIYPPSVRLLALTLECTLAF